VICAALVAIYRPHPWSGASERVNFWAGAVALVMAAQLVPLPAAVVDRLSPHARAVRQAFSLSPVTGALPLSIDSAWTLWAVGVYAGLLALFYVCQTIFAAGGVRIVARGIATTGLLLSAVSLAQEATAHGLIYWHWATPTPVAPPFGPFFNRDHYATWVVMALPLTLGYLRVHAAAHARPEPLPGAGWRTSLRHAADARSLWLAAAICLMLVGLVASQSRAGMAGLLAALAAGALWQRQRPGEARSSAWIAVAVAMAILLALARVDPAGLLRRFGASGGAMAGRLHIWQATLPVVRDFWLTGTGAGTYETVMLAQPREPSLFRINAAHNHYLQMFTDGGLLMAVPIVLAVIAFVRVARGALQRDRSGMFLVRAGALSGLAGAAVQSIWETGWATPANAILAAILAAIVVHEPPRPSGRATG
jgi:hypothetical protein